MKDQLTTPPAPAATADVVDQHGDALDVCELRLRQYGGVTDFTGIVRTVRCHEDNALVKSVLAEPGEGRVLVVDGGGSLATALLGDLIAGAAVDQAGPAWSTGACATSWRCEPCPSASRRSGRSRARARRPVRARWMSRCRSGP